MAHNRIRKSPQSYFSLSHFIPHGSFTDVMPASHGMWSSSLPENYFYLNYPSSRALRLKRILTLDRNALSTGERTRQYSFQFNYFDFVIIIKYDLVIIMMYDLAIIMKYDLVIIISIIL